MPNSINQDPSHSYGIINEEVNWNVTWIIGIIGVSRVFGCIMAITIFMVSNKNRRSSLKALAQAFSAWAFLLTTSAIISLLLNRPDYTPKNLYGHAE